MAVMGAKSHMEPAGFSADLNAYLKKVLQDNGRQDLSGRWLTSITGGARKHDYWGGIVKNTRAMTTNDVQVLAQTFGISPYEWVANTRRFRDGQPVPVLIHHVGAHDEDYDISEDPGEELAGAAETPRTPD